eukprot:2746182-Pleurochrysis_carterae.AAC.1
MRLVWGLVGSTIAWGDERHASYKSRDIHWGTGVGLVRGVGDHAAVKAALPVARGCWIHLRKKSAGQPESN